MLIIYDYLSHLQFGHNWRNFWKRSNWSSLANEGRRSMSLSLCVCIWCVYAPACVYFVIQSRHPRYFSLKKSYLRREMRDASQGFFIKNIWKNIPSFSSFTHSLTHSCFSLSFFLSIFRSEGCKNNFSRCKSSLNSQMHLWVPISARNLQIPFLLRVQKTEIRGSTVQYHLRAYVLYKREPLWSPWFRSSKKN